LITKLLVLRHIDREGPDLIGALAQQRGFELQTIRLDQGEPLPDPSQCHNTIALVLGGPMGVNDRQSPGMDWLQRELDWVTIWHQHHKPILGICLGAQLLALAAGGSVTPLRLGEPPTPSKEVGFAAVTWCVHPANEPWLKGCSNSNIALHWHGDRIHLPATATLLGSSVACAEQVFRIGQHALGLQCHWEVQKGNLERWIQEDHEFVVDALGEHGPNHLRHEVDRLGDTVEQFGQRFLSNALDQLSLAVPTIKQQVD
jgi:GMP synthase (glutamine-hydrolysing)